MTKYNKEWLGSQWGNVIDDILIQEAKARGIFPQEIVDRLFFSPNYAWLLGEISDET